MINAAIVGLGWWGKALVESVQGTSDVIQFKAGVARTHTPELKAFGDLHNMKLAGRIDDVLSDPKIDAIVLATPHSLHSQQVVAAANAGKHVFCEKPFALHRKEAEDAVAAVRAARVVLGLGYNRRLHPEMMKLRERVRSGSLGTIMHVEATMTSPNALLLQGDQWRADKDETPVGGLTPMGVHAIDGMIDLCGEIDSVYCLSFRRAIQVEADDTSSMIFHMKAGMSGYLGTMTATGPGFSFQIFGSKGFVRLEGMTHVAGASSEERRTTLFGRCKFQPINGEAEYWEGARFDVVRAILEAFGTAAAGGAPFPITLDEMVHGAAVTEAVIKSAESGRVERP